MIKDEPECIIGWKNLANFFGVKDPRTIKNWHARVGLPIIFLGKSPIAYKYVLREWLVRVEAEIHCRQM